MLPQQAQGRTDASRSAEMLARLMERAGLINRIHEALRSTVKLEDLCNVVVGILFSQRGLGFSRAILLRWDEKLRSYHVCGALGALDPQTHQHLRREIGEGQMPAANAGSEKPSVNGTGEERLFSTDPKDLKDHSFWKGITNKLSQSNPLLNRLSTLSISEIECTGDEAGAHAFAELFESGACLQLNPAHMCGACAPSDLREILDADALFAGIKTQRGTRFVLVADKAFEARPIDEVDKLHVNWFSGQLALAMDNAELFHDLETTNAGLQELDTLKSNFLSTISHELRTPLTAITGFTRLLVNNKVGMVSPGQKQILDRVLAHSERLVNIVNDLIEIAEIDSGSAVNLRVHPIDPLNILMETIPKLEPRKKSKNVAVDPVVTGPVPHILADEKGLGRIFYHLIDNAIKFSKENGGVKIEFVPGDTDLAIHISDQGIGIPPERVRLIFEAFYQVDSQLARVYEGMGIGLTLTKKLVAGTGGRLLVKSELGQGSTFTIIYPKA